ncbi:MAG: TonB-dependent receptor [Acidobacteriota bacterium]|nr:TonB-dependent receptor [Acidobacteriota bacterium]
MTRRAGWMKALLSTALLATAMTAAQAQDTTGSISGTITDNSGAAIKGATVTLTNTDRAQDIRTLTTDGAGFYTGTTLPLGTYTVKVTDAGFKSAAETGLVLHVNDKLTVNKQLAVGSSNQEVTVTADQVQLNFQDAASATLISGTQVRELPLNNRNYEQLVSLQPGVSYGGGDQLYIGLSNPSGETNVVSFSINGSRNSSNNWTLDGADNVDRGSNLTLLAYPSVDAIGEFKTLRGTFSAEYGRSASGQVNVVTRSGTNAFHGTAYEFFRNNVFNANNYFSNRNGLARPALRYNDFGYTFGGPVWIPKVYNGRDKTFFFFSQEFRRVITYSLFTSLGVPTLAERQGNFGTALVCASVNPTNGTCNNAGTTQINPATFSPLAQAYLKDVYANVPAPDATHTLRTNQRNQYNQTQEILRIDHSFGQKLSGFFRFINDKLPTVEPGGLFSGTGYPGVQTTSTNSPGRTYLGHATYVFNPRLLIDGGYAYSSGAIISDPTGQVLSSNSPDIKPTLPFANQVGRIPALSFSGAQGIGGFGPYRDFDRNHNGFVNLSKTLGQHSVRAGVTYNHYQKTENAGGGNQGTFSFSTNGAIPLCNTKVPPTNQPCTTDPTQVAFNFQQSFANFLTGFVNNFNQTSLDLTPNIQNNSIEAYVQDDWKVMPRLTLNLGVRYSYFPQPVDKNNLLTTFDPTLYVAANAPTLDANGFLCIPGAPCTGGVTPNPNYNPLNGISINGTTSPFGAKVGRTDKYNFAPRVGFAYDVFGNGTAALRGGFGIAYDTALYGIYEQNTFANPPFLQSPNIPNTSFDNPAAGTAKLNVNPISLHATAPNFSTPYTEQYSFDLQQTLMRNLVLDVGYFGEAGRNLLGIVDLNEVQPGAYVAAGLGTGTPPVINNGNTPSLNRIRPFLGYTAINSIQPIFTSNYNSLQVSLQKRFSGASLVDINYTWSRALTNDQSDRSTAPQNTYNIGAEYGRSQLDRNQILTADFVYELPWLREQHGLVGRVAGGWELAGIVSMNSGLPFTATIGNGIDPGGLGILGPSAAGPRPDQVGDPNSGPNRRSLLHFFNTAAFAPVPAGAFRPGNARRGTINGPGFQRWDLSFYKNIKVFERSAFQFRAESFNTFNHTNFDQISTSTTSSIYGQVFAARDARVLQVGLKFNF